MLNDHFSQTAGRLIFGESLAGTSWATRTFLEMAASVLYTIPASPLPDSTAPST